MCFCFKPQSIKMCLFSCVGDYTFLYFNSSVIVLCIISVGFCSGEIVFMSRQTFCLVHLLYRSRLQGNAGIALPCLITLSKQDVSS